MLFEKIVQLAIIYKVHKYRVDSSKRAQQEREKEKANADESILDVFNRKMKEYTNSNNQDDSSDNDDSDDDNK